MGLRLSGGVVDGGGGVGWAAQKPHHMGTASFIAAASGEWPGGVMWMLHCIMSRHGAIADVANTHIHTHTPQTHARKHTQMNGKCGGRGGVVGVVSGFVGLVCWCRRMLVFERGCKYVYCTLDDRFVC